MIEVRVRLAAPPDAAAIGSLLHGAEAWLRSRGVPMWLPEELGEESLLRDVAAGMHYVAEASGEVVGTLRFQLDDPEFWPDRPAGEAAYVHRLAVRRDHARTGVGAALLDWAAERAGHLGLPRLRLDCDHDRPRLRAFYERNGFRFHSERQVGPFLVARYERAVETADGGVTYSEAFP